MTNNSIELIDVSYRYPRTKRTVIRKLNLTVPKGELLAVMGENGAGKSTLCQILNGIIPHSAGGRLRGQVFIEGIDTKESSVGQLSTKVGIVLEDPETQLFTTSVLNEVAFGPENLRMPVDEILARAKRVLKLVRLDGYEDRPPTDLSGGQKQRLAIAAGLVMQPSILILDESTSQIDPLGVVEVLSLVQKLNKELGMTIIMATDKSEEVARIADHILVLDEGREVAYGTPREIFADTGLFKKFMIRAPQVSQLGAALQEAEHPLPIFPIVLDEARAGIVELLDGMPGGPPTPDSGGAVPLPILEERGSPSILEEHGSPQSWGVRGAAETSAQESIITVDHLSYVYQSRNVLAVDDVNFDIKKGEFVAIIGQNGSGKTTILKNLLGLLHPASGKVTVAGLDTKQTAVSELARHVGFVLQNPDQQLFAETIEQEIAFGPQNLGVDEAEVKRRVDEAIEMVGLECDKLEFPPALPKGDRAKVVIASALALNPEIMVLDEPTTGQDYKGCHQILQIARKLHEENRTVVFVTHHMALVAEYAQRVIIMCDGKILLDSKTEHVFSQPDMIRKAHIIPPQITELSQQLPESLELPRTPLTVQQLSEAILMSVNQ
ncbi:MAG: energy-coupling factor transporter ATPase [Chloroflexota bacterium]|nr:energy-coupling factor transporter ATPase [Chloroflexota bacterium]